MFTVSIFKVIYIVVALIKNFMNLWYVALVLGNSNNRLYQDGREFPDFQTFDSFSVSLALLTVPTHKSVQ